jgi:hypothetical protein
VIYETHPFLEMFDPNAAQAFAPATSYFTKDPFISEAAITYDGTDDGQTAASYWFVHTMGDILTACARAGLILERLTDHSKAIKFLGVPVRNRNRTVNSKNHDKPLYR